MTSESLAAQADAVTSVVTERMLDGERLQVVKAPPGAGKTHLLLQLLAADYGKGLRLAVATFTNAQADDVCRRLASEHPDTPVVRFISSSAPDPELGPTSVIARSRGDLPHGPCVVVGSTAKWGLTACEPFDLLLVDEAWQISWADFLLLRSVAGCFVLIGDPGQIPPSCPWRPIGGKRLPMPHISRRPNTSLPKVPTGPWQMSSPARGGFPRTR